MALEEKSPKKEWRAPYLGEPDSFSPEDHLRLGQQFACQFLGNPNVKTYLACMMHLSAAKNQSNLSIIEPAVKTLKELEKARSISHVKVFYEEVDKLVAQMKSERADGLQSCLAKIRKLVPEATKSLKFYDDRENFAKYYFQPFSPTDLLELATNGIGGAGLDLPEKVYDEVYALEARVLWHEFMGAQRNLSNAKKALEASGVFKSYKQAVLLRREKEFFGLLEEKHQSVKAELKNLAAIDQRFLSEQHGIARKKLLEGVLPLLPEERDEESEEEEDSEFQNYQKSVLALTKESKNLELSFREINKYSECFNEAKKYYILLTKMVVRVQNKSLLDSRIIFFFRFESALKMPYDTSQYNAFLSDWDEGNVLSTLIEKRHYEDEMSKYAKAYLNDPDVLSEITEKSRYYRVALPKSNNIESFNFLWQELIRKGEETCQALQKKFVYHQVESKGERRASYCEENDPTRIAHKKLSELSEKIQALKIGALFFEVFIETAETLFEPLLAIETLIGELIQDQWLFPAKDREQLKMLLEECRAMRLEIFQIQRSVATSIVSYKKYEKHVSQTTGFSSSSIKWKGLGIHDQKSEHKGSGPADLIQSQRRLIRTEIGPKGENLKKFVEDFLGKIESLVPIFLPKDEKLVEYNYPSDACRPADVLKVYEECRGAFEFHLSDSEKNRLLVLEARILRYEIESLKIKNPADQEAVARLKEEVEHLELAVNDPRDFSAMDHYWIAKRFLDKPEPRARSYLECIEHLHAAKKDEKNPRIASAATQALLEIRKEEAISQSIKDVEKFVLQIQAEGESCIQERLKKIRGLVPEPVNQLAFFDDLSAFESYRFQVFSPLDILRLAVMDKNAGGAGLTLSAEIKEDMKVLEARILWYQYSTAPQEKKRKYFVQLLKVSGSVMDKRKLDPRIIFFLRFECAALTDQEKSQYNVDINDPDLLFDSIEEVPEFKAGLPKSNNFQSFNELLHKLVGEGEKIHGVLHEKFESKQPKNILIVREKLSALHEKIQALKKLAGSDASLQTLETPHEPISAIEAVVDEMIRDKSVFPVLADRKDLRMLWDECRAMRLETLRVQRSIPASVTAQSAVPIPVLSIKWEGSGITKEVPEVKSVPASQSKPETKPTEVAVVPKPSKQPSPKKQSAPTSGSFFSFSKLLGLKEAPLVKQIPLTTTSTTAGSALNGKS